MADNGTAGVEPKGLNMSLDAIIKNKVPEKKGDQPRSRNDGFQKGSHRGRGRRGPSDQGGRGRGRSHHQGLPQQNWQVWHYASGHLLFSKPSFAIPLLKSSKHHEYDDFPEVSSSHILASTGPFAAVKGSQASLSCTVCTGTTTWNTAVSSQCPTPRSSGHWSRDGCPWLRAGASIATRIPGAHPALQLALSMSI